MKNQTQAVLVDGVQETPVIHTHMSREIRPIRNWLEWLERWQAALCFEEMLGLLHVGMDVPTEHYHADGRRYDEVDRVIFYFSVADGWKSRWSLELPDDGNTKYVVGRDNCGNLLQKSPSEMRQMLARKAFDILCQSFFKTEFHDSRNGYMPVWDSLITGDRLFPVIQNFFRAEKAWHRDLIDVRNLPTGDKIGHNEEQAVRFLLTLATFILDWSEEGHLQAYYSADERKKVADRDAKKRLIIDASKPWLIEVLTQLDHLEILRARIMNLDRSCVAKLKEIALRNEFSDHSHPVNKDRRAVTVDEACYLGSPTAWLYVERELRMREHRRLTEIKEAQDKQRRAEERVRQLTSK